MLGYLKGRYDKRTHFRLLRNLILSKNLGTSGLTLKQVAGEEKMNVQLKYTAGMLCKG